MEISSLISVSARCTHSAAVHTAPVETSAAHTASAETSASHTAAPEPAASHASASSGFQLLKQRIVYFIKPVSRITLYLDGRREKSDSHEDHKEFDNKQMLFHYSTSPSVACSISIFTAPSGTLNVNSPSFICGSIFHLSTVPLRGR